MRVRLTRSAESELTAAIEWYDTQATGLGKKFLSEFTQLKQRLGENPRQFPRIYKDARRAPFHRFPYGLFFRVTNDIVEVFACFHFSRDPAQWQRRI
jgi:plasmid stabilization system protein ParE